MPQTNASRIVSLYGDLALEIYDGYGHSHLVYLTGEPEKGFTLPELDSSKYIERVLAAHGISASSGSQDAGSPSQRLVHDLRDLFLQIHSSIGFQRVRRKRLLNSN